MQPCPGLDTPSALGHTLIGFRTKIPPTGFGRRSLAVRARFQGGTK